VESGSLKVGRPGEDKLQMGMTYLRDTAGIGEPTVLWSACGVVNNYSRKAFKRGLLSMSSYFVNFTIAETSFGLQKRI
jgi:hypothetical protein